MEYVVQIDARMEDSSGTPSWCTVKFAEFDSWGDAASFVVGITTEQALEYERMVGAKDLCVSIYVPHDDNYGISKGRVFWYEDHICSISRPLEQRYPEEWLWYMA